MPMRCGAAIPHARASRPGCRPGSMTAARPWSSPTRHGWRHAPARAPARSRAPCWGSRREPAGDVDRGRPPRHGGRPAQRRVIRLEHESRTAHVAHRGQAPKQLACAALVPRRERPRTRPRPAPARSGLGCEAARREQHHARTQPPLSPRRRTNPRPPRERPRTRPPRATRRPSAPAAHDPAGTGRAGPHDGDPLTASPADRTRRRGPGLRSPATSVTAVSSTRACNEAATATMGLAVSSRASALIAVEGQHLGGASRGVWGGAPTLLRARPVVPRARPRRACGRRGREVLPDGLLGHVQRVRDLAVRASVGGHRRHPPFGGGESVGAGEPGRRGRAPAISSSVRARSASTSTASRRRSRSSEIAASVRRAIPIARPARTGELELVVCEAERGIRPPERGVLRERFGLQRLELRLCDRAGVEQLLGLRDLGGGPAARRVAH